MSGMRSSSAEYRHETMQQWIAPTILGQSIRQRKRSRSMNTPCGRDVPRTATIELPRTRSRPFAKPSSSIRTTSARMSCAINCRVSLLNRTSRPAYCMLTYAPRRSDRIPARAESERGGRNHALFGRRGAIRAHGFCFRAGPGNHFRICKRSS